MEDKKLVHRGAERGQRWMGMGVKIPPLEPLEDLGK